MPWWNFPLWLSTVRPSSSSNMGAIKATQCHLTDCRYYMQHHQIFNGFVRHSQSCTSLYYLVSHRWTVQLQNPTSPQDNCTASTKQTTSAHEKVRWTWNKSGQNHEATTSLAWMHREGEGKKEQPWWISNISFHFLLKISTSNNQIRSLSSYLSIFMC